MKVLTIKQPFATLIMEGIKEYEFRTWNTKYRGELLIHAGKGVDKKALEKYKHLNLEYPKGCIIGKVNLDSVIKIDDEARNMLSKKNKVVYSHVINDTNWDGYGWKLNNIKKINHIEINGQLGLWNYDYKER